MDGLINSKYFKKEISKLNTYDKIVFCDIDGTIYRKSLFLDLLYMLMDEGYVSDGKIKIFNKNKKARKNRELSYDEFIMYSVVEIFEKLIQSGDLQKSVLEAMSKDIIKNNGKQILTYTMNKLKDLQSQGYKIIFISGSPLEMVRDFVKMYGFDIGFGTFLEVGDDGYYTGKREVLASSKNKNFLINYIKSIVLPSDVISFGDTNGDYDMLTSANIGVAINPSKELFEKIRNNPDIMVIIERKDLILELPYEIRGTIKFY